MRDLESTATNKIVLNDGRSGTQIELYYRTPTTQEEVDYTMKAYKRKGNKLIINTGVKITIALGVLTGFREGDFGLSGKPIASDPASENYCAEWKEVLRKSAGDILIAFAMAVFEGIRVNSDFTGEVDVETVIEEEAPPLAKNSGE